MTKEECIALLIRYAEYDGMGIPNLAGCKEAMRMAAKLLSQPQPSLPSNLDEAADKFAHFYDNGTCDGIAQECFKAGAEWMAGQGETVTKACVIELNEDKGLHWLQMDGSNLCNALKNFNIGDKVVVQIRKK